MDSWLEGKREEVKGKETEIVYLMTLSMSPLLDHLLFPSSSPIKKINK